MSQPLKPPESSEYIECVSMVQAAANSLQVPIPTAACGLWLFASFYRSDNQPPADPMSASLACLLIAEKNRSNGNPPRLTPPALVDFLLRFQDSDPVDIEHSLVASIERVDAFAQRAPPFTFSSPCDSIMDIVRQIFGGSFWPKNPFVADDLLPVAMGVINDMFRSDHCIDFSAEHWAFAAVHYAFCTAVSGESNEGDMHSAWHLWIKHGVRWWVNFENTTLLEDGSKPAKFEPLPILDVLLRDVYSHIRSNSPFYAYLMHPSLAHVECTAPHSQSPVPTSFDAFTFADDTECSAFSLDVDVAIPLLHQLVVKKDLVHVRYGVEYKECDPLELREDGCSTLFLAAEKGDLEMVRYFVDEYTKHDQLQAMINTPKQTGATPLHVAVFLGHREIVSYLIDQGADVNTQLKTNGNTPLYDAINQGRAGIAEILLDCGAKADVLCINGGVCMHAAAFADSPTIIERLAQVAPDTLEARKAPYGETPLLIAVQAGRLKAVEKLLVLGCETSRGDFRYACFEFEGFRGLTAWHCVLFKKDSTMLQTLMATGAMPDSSVLQLNNLGRIYQSLVRPSYDDDQHREDGAGELPIAKQARV